MASCVGTRPSALAGDRRWRATPKPHLAPAHDGPSSRLASIPPTPRLKGSTAILEAATDPSCRPVASAKPRPNSWPAHPALKEVAEGSSPTGITTHVELQQSQRRAKSSDRAEDSGVARLALDEHDLGLRLADGLSVVELGTRACQCVGPRRQL